MTDWVEEHHQRKKTKKKGGPGSGHWGHAGRPGKRGGSLPGKGRDRGSSSSAGPSSSGTTDHEWNGDPDDLLAGDRERWEHREAYITEHASAGYDFARYLKERETSRVGESHYPRKTAPLRRLSGMLLLTWESVADLNQFGLARASQANWDKRRWEKEVRGYLDRFKPFNPGKTLSQIRREQDELPEYTPDWLREALGKKGTV